jgi:hypothetical protein
MDRDSTWTAMEGKVKTLEPLKPESKLAWNISPGNLFPRTTVVARGNVLI